MSPVAAAEPGTTNLAHFEKKIRPVLTARCYSCHAADAKELKGGLALDTRAGLLQGGDSGPAVVPGNAKASLLIAAIRHEGGLEMPPQQKLTDEQIADFVRWIDAGATDPRDGVAAKPAAALDIERGRQFWAFQRPVKTPPPTPKETTWPLSDIDRFVLDAQEKNGVTAAADADPSVLVRRLYFDLIGLPPTTQESEQFVRHIQGGGPHALETTLKQSVDRLLESSQFGERWGRHWLDVARYAESTGKESNHNYPHAWRYRDYVIDSLNADVPFDRFIREQIAGDLLPAEDDIQKAEQIVATTFLAVGPKSLTERNKKKFELDVVDEQIEAVTQAFLGLTVACARCHDHKFDPIPQADYYALAGIFRSTELLYGTIPVITNANPSNLWTLPHGSAMSVALPPLTTSGRERLEKLVADTRVKGRESLRDRKTGTQEIVRNRILIGTLEAKLNSYNTDGSAKALSMGARDRVVARNSELFIRGEVDKPGRTIPRGFVQVLCEDKGPTIGSGSGRLELAEWIASGANPLTARVFVNRVWQHLFGRGLVTTPDNFGASGQPPSHPALLDHLATTFVDDGWSVKRLIRRIVLSHVYRQNSTHNAANFAKDPDNVWLWRMSPRRLDAEAIRDAMLSIAGRLELKPPVGSAVALGGDGFSAGLELGRQLDEQRLNCRAVYLPVIRGRMLESLEEFDGVDGSGVTGQRSETTVPSQSLYLLNSPFVMGLANSAARRLMAESTESNQRVETAYQRWFGRMPSAAEKAAAVSFVSRYQEQSKADGWTPGGPQMAAWTAFCQSLWASSEFLVRK
ncbi:MAG: PSD1 and planctomycete cytochrome C domain-containing protein [Planctomycetota bacterium]